jgi:topoisomerase-4 subunit A
MFPFEQGAKRLIASDDGYGFIVADEEMISSRRAGKQVMNVGEAARVRTATPAIGDRVAVIGENRKLLVFDLGEIPEMQRGKGVKLQSYKDGGLADALVFDKAEGLAWIDSAGRTRAVPEWPDYRGKRGAAGRLAPRGFSRSGRFRDTLGG